MLLSFYYKMWNNILGQFFQQGKDFHFTKEKRIMAGAQLRTSCKVYVNNQKFCLFHASLSLMNFIINNHDFFKQIHLYTALVQEIIIIFSDQMPIYLVFKDIHFEHA